MEGRRYEALDAFRGLTIAAMILVNNPGSWSHIFPPLRHAPWHGLTPTDLVFPFFLFIVGTALVFSRRLRPPAEGGGGSEPILFRALLLVLVGVLIAGFPYIELSGSGFWHAKVLRWRLPGVLQRIGLCYLAAALLWRSCRPRTLLVIGGVILVGYDLALHLVPVPGHGAGALDGTDSNLAAWVDRQVFGARHMWKKEYDPEGLLSTLPALVTTLLGLWAGTLVRGSGELTRRLANLFALGSLLALTGVIWSWFSPVNKALWTAPYVLVTGGLATLGLAACAWAIDLQGWRRWAFPLRVYGRNALAVFVGSALVGRLLVFIRVADGGGGTLSLKGWLWQGLFASWLPPVAASFAWALLWLVGWFGVLLLLHRRGVVIKL